MATAAGAQTGPFASGPFASGPFASGPFASGPAASGPFASGWSLEPDASTLNFQSVKNETKVESPRMRRAR